MSYRPKPLDDSRVALGPEFAGLLEQLAENTHEVWAALRFRQGWTHGPRRDDATKKHPCLVGYNQLPDAEKIYDRDTATGVLKALLMLGYSITPPHSRARHTDADFARLLLTELRSKKSKLELLRTLWEKRALRDWAHMPEVYDLLAEILCAKGEPFWGYDVAAEGLSFFPGRARLVQLQAWALAQSGATRGAEALLTNLHGAGHLDSETLGLLGRVYKDLASVSEGEKRRAFLEQARGYYIDGCRMRANSYNGINAASLTLLLSSTPVEIQEAMRLADQAAAACREEAELHGASLWTEATLGEAALVNGKVEEAAGYYTKFSMLARANLGALQSTRAQAKRIMAERGLDRGLADAWMPAPPIVLFAGHMIDAPDRPTPRLANGDCHRIKAEIHERLEGLDARVGFSSAACGSDILFLEAMIERGGEIHVTLPCALEAFRELSVLKPGGEEWARRFDAILPNLSTLHVASHQHLPDSPVLWEFGNLTLLGLSRIKARIWDAPLRTLVVWDQVESAGPKGTAACVKLWKNVGLDVAIIPVAAGQTTPVKLPSNCPPQEIKAMLFADIVGFCNLPEHEVPAYVDAFFSGIAEMLKSLAHPPIIMNTWGDAVYFVFDTAQGAGECALHLRDFVLNKDWLGSGLCQSLAIRIGVHAGPVFRVRNQLNDAPDFIGANVNRAAQMEPISAESQAYASEAFAALAEAEECRSFCCDYVGERNLPKKGGILRVYRIERGGHAKP